MPIKKYRFCFKATLDDETAEEDATFFSWIANIIKSHDCSEMVVKLGHTDPHVLPEPILNLRGIKKTFQLHYNHKTSKGKMDFMIDEVMEISTKNGDTKETNTNPAPPPNEAQCLLEHN